MPQDSFTDSLLERSSYTDRLLKKKSYTNTLLEEVTTPWKTIIEGVKRAGELTRAGGPYDPLSLKNWGESWTMIARLFPGQEDLPPWEEQSPGRQIVTGTQIGVLAPLFYTLWQTGVTSIADLREAFKYNRALKKAALKAIKEVKPKYTEPGHYQVYEKETTGQIRSVARQKVKGEETFFPVTKEVSAQPPSMQMMARDFERGGMKAVVDAVKQRFAVVEIVKREPLRLALESLAKTQFKATVPTVAGSEKVAADIAKHVVTGLPASFKPQIAETLIDQSLKLIAAAIPQLEAFNSFTLPKREIDEPVKGVVEREFAERPITTAEVGVTPTAEEAVTEEVIAPITEHQLQTIQSLRGEKKFSPRLMRKAAMAFADKDSVEALNEREAAALIEGLKAAPLRATGKAFIPPYKGDLLPSHFFVKGRPAGFLSWFPAAWRYMEWIGAKEIYDKVEVPYINYQREVHDKYRFFDELKKSVKGVKGAEKRLFHYLNGTLPETITLSPQETTAAKELRTILDDYADRLNLPPERRRENYIYHLFEAATQRALREKHPFVDEKNKDVPLTDAMISALGLKIPKEIFTPTLLQRLGRKQGLVEDVWKSMRAVTSIDLRRIHLQPAFEEIRPLIKGYPETSRSYINDWLAYAVLKQEPNLDKTINASINRYTTFIENATKGKISFGSNPMKTMGYTFARLGYGGTVAFNLAIVGKNLTQQMLTLPLLNNPVHYGQAFGDIFTAKGHYLLKQSKVLTERFPMEAFDPKDVGKWIQKGMAPYRFVDWANVAIAFLSGVRDAQAMNLPPDEVIKYGDRIAKISQYSYRPIDMPRFMWQGGGAGRIAGMLQSWPINYFTNYLPELVHGTVTGYDTAGNKLPLHARGRLLEHLLIASLFIYGMYKYRRVDFRKTFGPGVMPTYLSPGLSLSLAVGKRVLGFMRRDYEMTKDADRKLSNSIPMFIPAGLQIKKTYDAYQRLTTGIETDAGGRWKRNVSVEEAITGVFTYPAQRSDFYATQKKVWELESRIRKKIDKRSLLQHRGANYSRIRRIEDELDKLNEEHHRFAEKLGKIKEGYPTEDDREWIESLLHTWSLWP